MSLVWSVVILVAAAAAVFKTTEWFVRGTVDIATALRLPKMFIGITLVSLVTTLPEFIVSVSSSWLGEAGMAVGASVGTFICNIGLVFAVGIILSEVLAQREDFQFRMTFLVVALLIFYLFCLDGILERREACVLLLLLVFFMFMNYRMALKGREKIPLITEPGRKNRLLKTGAILFLTGGAGTVLLARYGLLDPGLEIARGLKVPPIVIGLSVIAVGTSLPELFTAIVASRKKHGEIALGNVIGANVLNLLWVLGVAALVAPLPLDKQTLYFSLPSALFFSAALFLLGFAKLSYSRKEGIFLIASYLIYLVAVFFVLY